MTNETPIRKATAADAQAIFDIRIAAINSQCTGHYPAHDLEVWTTWRWSQQFVQMIEDKAYVAMVGDKIIASGMVDLASGQIDAVFVHPSQMRRGIGRMMMEHLERLAFAAGLAQLKLDATLNAAPFYRSLGFVGDTLSSYCSSSGVALACIPMTKRLFPGGEAVVGGAIAGCAAR